MIGEGSIRRIAGGDSHRGVVIVLSVLEMHPHDELFRPLIVQHLGPFQGFHLKDTITGTERTGERIIM